VLALNTRFKERLFLFDKVDKTPDWQLSVELVDIFNVLVDGILIRLGQSS
jgi:hypothetical protein